jgi:two-component system, LytTR family, sensor kinase
LLLLFLVFSCYGKIAIVMNNNAEHPNRTLSLWLLSLLTMIAVVRALQHFYVVDAYEPVQFGLWWHIPFNLFLWWSWMVFIPVIRWSIEKAESDRYKFGWWFFVYFSLPILTIVIRQTAAAYIVASVLVGYSDFHTQVFKRIVGNSWMWLDIAAYYTIVVVIRIVDYRRKNLRSELKVDRLQTQLAQSQLTALESQLHPHFLFNTLNTVSTMILKKENTEAERMLSLLQNFLKTTVSDGAHHEIPLIKELRFINDYLEIEKVRFNDKLTVKEDISNDSLNAMVPNLLLQPIIENAIYHAIAPKITNGVIRIVSRKDHRFLHITVEDNGPGIERSVRNKRNSGVGIRITRERLSHLFGSDYRFDFEKSTLGGLKVVIQIPFVPAAGGAAA